MATPPNYHIPGHVYSVQLPYPRTCLGPFKSFLFSSWSPSFSVPAPSRSLSPGLSPGPPGMKEGAGIIIRHPTVFISAANELTAWKSRRSEVHSPVFDSSRDLQACNLLLTVPGLALGDITHLLLLCNDVVIVISLLLSSSLIT